MKFRDSKSYTRDLNLDGIPRDRNIEVEALMFPEMVRIVRPLHPGACPQVIAGRHTSGSVQ